MKTALYKNGAKAVVVRVDHVMFAHDVALYWLLDAHKHDINDEDAVEVIPHIVADAEKISEREVLKSVREILRGYGDQTPFYNFGDDASKGMKLTLVKVEEIFTDRFGFTVATRISERE